MKCVTKALCCIVLIGHVITTISFADAKIVKLNSSKERFVFEDLSLPLSLSNDEEVEEPIQVYQTQEIKKAADPNYCMYAGLGIKFLCKPTWQLHPAKDGILVIVSDDPAVTFTIEKLNSSVIMLEQITKSYLSALGLYAKGFAIEKVPLANKEAVMVKAFSKVYPEKRLLDYYLIHNKELYSFSFSINPREKWDLNKFLVRDVAHSLSFLKYEIEEFQDFRDIIFNY